MKFEVRSNFVQKTKSAWIRGKSNQRIIPLEIAEIKDIVFLKKDEKYELAYKVEYEDMKIGYIYHSELSYCEIFPRDSVIQ